MLSVIWFLGFGLFLWHTAVNDAVAPYTLNLDTCYRILNIDNDALQFISDPSERDKKQAANWQKYKNCQSQAREDWERGRPDDRLQAAVVVGVDLVTIGFGWLVAWLGVVIVGWIRRGFASA